MTTLIKNDTKLGEGAEAQAGQTVIELMGSASQ